MAAATQLLARSSSAVAVLNYDDVTLLATGITITNISGIEPVKFFVIIGGQTFSRTVAIGQTAIISFAASASCTIGTAPNGRPNFVVAGLDSYGIGSA